MELEEAICARGSVVCVVGAGGKKSTLYALADRLERAIVTATVRIPPFVDQVADLRVSESPLEVIDSITEWPVGLVADRERSDRYRGYAPETVDAIAAVVPGEVSVLVKADGARTRWLKAPNDREPQLPAAADVVVPVAGVRVVGKPLDEEYVHRPERVGQLTEKEQGESIMPADVATVLTSDRGGWKDVPAGARVVPVLNMVDTPDLERTARTIAAEIRDRRDPSRIVLTRLLDDRPVVDVV